MLERSLERARVREHLEGALDRLTARVPDDLAPVVARRRSEAIAALRRYIDAEEYPRNDCRAGMTPIFVDAHGARCAVAALIEASGERSLVERIARENNFAYVAELAAIQELAAWLNAHGLTVDEAARIQPAYDNTVETSWQPTVSIIASAQAGGSINEGAELALSGGARFGVRRIEESGRGGACDVCVYRSDAWTAEYTRTVVVGIGATNQIGALWHHDLGPWKLMGGPLLSIDESARPGFGIGAQFGWGFDFRRRSVPLLVEVVASALGGKSEGIALRAGPVVGLVW